MVINPETALEKTLFLWLGREVHVFDRLIGRLGSLAYLGQNSWLLIGAERVFYFDQADIVSYGYDRENTPYIVLAGRVT